MTQSILIGDVREQLATLPDASVQCCVTSPPYYGHRDYGVSGQIGLEPTLAEYLATMVDVFREVRRVLRPDGTCWVNMGDSYAGSWGAQSREHAGKYAPNVSAISANQVKAAQRKSSNTGTIRDAGLKPKDLMMVPARLAISLCDDGWWLRSDIIWAKPNPMPESVRDRPTSSHEHIFLLTKQSRYFYDADAVREEMSPESVARYAYSFGGAKNEALKAGDKPTAVVGMRDATAGRNLRNVWHLGPEPYPDAHFATFPTEIPRRCIKAGSREGDTILDPFLGSGTTLLVAKTIGRDGIGIELNPDYAAMAQRRIAKAPGFSRQIELRECCDVRARG